jgi:LEA14-like dessication related protein
MLRFWMGMATIVAAALSGGCAALSPLSEPPRVVLVDLQLAGSTVLEQRYLLTLRVQNPNATPLDIDGLSLELALNHQPFLSGVSDQAVVVPAYGEALTRLEASSTLLGIVRQVEALERTGSGRFSYELNGGISLRGYPGAVRFSHRGDLGPAMLRDPARPY